MLLECDLASSSVRDDRDGQAGLNVQGPVAVAAVLRCFSEKYQIEHTARIG